jgi:Zn-dependent membrane protease YugP
MFFFDPMYLVFLLPGIALAAWAQWRVHSAYRMASQIRPRSGYVGAQAADAVMQSAGVEGVQIARTQGFLSDHYDPREKVLRLSPDVFDGQSLAALGIAAHESGHAIQDARRYPLLVMRNALVPLASFGSNASMLILIVGFVLASLSMFMLAKTFIYVGIAAFALTVLFQLVNLPVEFDASRRARIALQETGLVAPDEDPVVGKVLNAAALTYVAATLTAVLTLLYWLFRSGVLGGRRSGY